MKQEILDYNQSQSPSDKQICDLLLDKISKHYADTENVELKIWHGSPVWFHIGNPIVGYHSMKDCVRLLFWSGQTFEEPGLQAEGSFKAAEKRYTNVDQIDEDELKRWLEKALEIQWDYKNIVKRRGELVRLN